MICTDIGISCVAQVDYLTQPPSQCVVVRVTMGVNSNSTQELLYLCSQHVTNKTAGMMQYVRMCESGVSVYGLTVCVHVIVWVLKENEPGSQKASVQ